MTPRSALFSLCALSATAHGASCSLTASGGDDAPAFLSAMAGSACPEVTVPSGTTLSIHTSNKHLSLQGTIKFKDNLDYWTDNAFTFDFQDQTAFWLLGGKNIVIDGGGTLDGSGQAWYDKFAKDSSIVRPILLTIYQATNVTVENIKMINGPEWINFVNEGTDITFKNITITAQSTSSSAAKNTDGWDIFRSNNVVIQDSNVVNGDDCVSFKPNATNILVSNLSCDGSHGISVGSLNVTATNIRMSNAQNGARIKAWAGKGVGSGIVKNITFEGFVESNVDNPVIIDQCYMTDADECAENPSNTYIQDVWFTSISGTSSGKEKAVVASLDCSPGARCSGINVASITVAPPSKYGDATFDCQNVVLSGADASKFGTCKDTS
ncbi:glycoside hydrolase family 28 protein [Epithele typhae]|uniref:glycoside hydrolase family 28 protein n=1 Tax=Epithele typhae TaxID=378194 RepID=UPI0020073883|nr:glycoside hydrolase family 28 protein [Epithele typhae]KAH9940716.1 glycoside hydrolase family 28 protein [Epithele typhae]